MNRYTIVAGYHLPESVKYDDFFQTWLNNVCEASPSHVIIIADSGSRPPLADCQWDMRVRVTPVILQGDLGNCHQLLNGIKPHKFSGWTGVVLAGAMLAYTNETDMVFWEQDCLCFGDCIGQMYKEIGEAGIIFGECSFMPAAQSLFLVRHKYLPEFVRLFLSQPSQQYKENLGEHIFQRLEVEFPKEWKRFSFGYDRTRPVNYGDPVFYMQQIKPDELAELKKRGLI